jgi:hypothetical protein
MSYGNIQKRTRKTRRSKERIAQILVLDVTPTTEQSADFHIGEDLTAEQRNNFRTFTTISRRYSLWTRRM